MNVAGRIALIAGGAALGTGAVLGLGKLGASRFQQETDEVSARTDAAKREWDEFSTALEAEFPGFEVYSREDHARLDRFLQEHPAPSWVDVQHDGFTKIHLSTKGFLPDSLRRPIEEEVAYPIGFGGFMVLGGAGVAISSLRHAPTGLGGTIGATAGAAAIAAIGVGGILGGIQTSRFSNRTYGPVDALVQDVNSHR